MKQIIQLAACAFLTISINPLWAQKVGINTLTPDFTMDIRGTNDNTSGGELQLSTPTETNFLRLFSGRQLDPNPFLAFHDNDDFHFVTTMPDFSTYARRMTILGNGNVGIGTDNPLVKFDVNGPTSLGGLISTYNTGGSVYLGLGAGSSDDFTNNSNTAIGDFALSSNANGVSNVALGAGAMQQADGSVDNVAVGRNAMQNKASGNFNIAIGHSALQQNILGSSNIAIGRLAGQNETGSNKLYIENSSSTNPLIYGEFDTDYIKINGRAEVTGKLEIGDDGTAPAAGSMRYNSATQDFEGYDGSEWKSFTEKLGEGNLGAATAYYLETDTSQITFADFADGESIAVGGDIMVVGAPNFDDDLNDAFGTGLGSVAIYKKTSGVWSKIIVLNDPAMQVNSRFGYSVETDGQHIIVGSPGYDDGGNENEGRVYVYTRASFGFSWPLTATLNSPNAVDGQFLGDNLQLTGTDLIVGGPGMKNLIGGYTQVLGRVFIYHLDGGTWILQNGSSGLNSTLGDGFGADVAIDGNYAVVGAPAHTSEGNAYIFERNNGAWTEVANLNAANSPGAFSDAFGSTVAIRGTDVVVSAPFYQVNGNDRQGQIFGYEKVANNWLISFTETAPEALPDCRFGVVLKNFEDHLIVGSGLSKVKFHSYIKQGSTYSFESSFLSKKLNNNFDFDISNNIIVALDDNFQQQHILYYE